MSDEYLPTIPAAALIVILEQSVKFQKVFELGGSHIYTLPGSKYAGDRQIVIRINDDEIDYEYAMSIAIRANVIGAVMQWFEKHRDFKEGGYTLRNEKVSDATVNDNKDISDNSNAS